MSGLEMHLHYLPSLLRRGQILIAACAPHHDRIQMVVIRVGKDTDIVNQAQASLLGQLRPHVRLIVVGVHVRFRPRSTHITTDKVITTRRWLRILWRHLTRLQAPLRRIRPGLNMYLHMAPSRSYL